MNFEFGKEYIVKVSEKGIIPINEFNPERYFNKCEEEKAVTTENPKMGWIKIARPEDNTFEYKCPKCGIEQIYDSNYCPECGNQNKI